MGPLPMMLTSLIGPGELAVLDQEAVLHVEGEVAGPDLHLAVGEAGAVDALLHRGDDLVLLVRPRQHVGRAHAGHGGVLVALPAAVAGGRDTVVLRRDLVVQVRGEDTVLHEHRLPGHRALVVDVDGAAGVLLGALVHDVDEGLRHQLADLVGVDRHVLAVEVGLHAVADGLVEEDARRARREDHRHLAGRGRGGLEEDHRVLDALADHAVDPVRRVERDVVAGGDVVGVLLALAVLLGDAGEAHRGHGLQVLDDLPVRVGEEHRPRLVHEVDADLAHARVGAHGLLVHRAEERQLRLRPDVLPARLHGVARGQAAGRAEAHRRRARGAGRDGGRGLRREPQALGREVLGEAVAGLVALDDPHADAEVDVGEGPVHRAVLQQVGVAPPGAGRRRRRSRRRSRGPRRGSPGSASP